VRLGSIGMTELIECSMHRDGGSALGQDVKTV
jgi:hypothetical protein